MGVMARRFLGDGRGKCTHSMSVTRRPNDNLKLKTTHHPNPKVMTLSHLFHSDLCTH